MIDNASLQDSVASDEFRQEVTLNDMWSMHEPEFSEWLKARKLSASTERDYFSGLINIFNKYTICSPKDFRGLELADKESRGLRNLINYFEDEEMYEICGAPLERWRKNIKIKKSGICEIYITDDEVREGYKGCPEDVRSLYKLLVYSGNRLSHVHEVVKNFDAGKVVVEGDVAHYPTSSLSKGNKRTFQIYFPTAFIPELKKIDTNLAYKSLTKKLQVNRASAKTIRKWHLNMLVQAGVGESVADFIQGRSPTTVGSAHYLNKVHQATLQYSRVLDKFPI
ncbi:integrase [Methanococcoides sp. FTZ1]|uniref:integrase n=1 Tax=Methanococcoides sp. FTZ1 TaxID=3439061 RepID=UPI003F85F9F7